MDVLQSTDENEMSDFIDAGRPARGILIGLIISIPVWLLLGYLARHIGLV